jgi:hypothetical protein
MTSTPSRTASLIAATLSELKHPAGMPALPSQHTLYMAIDADGAIPEAVPILLPSMLTFTPSLPAAVDEVCEPCPDPSRGDRKSASATFCSPKPSR